MGRVSITLLCAGFIAACSHQPAVAPASQPGSAPAASAQGAGLPVYWGRPAQEDLGKLERQTAVRVKKAVRRYAESEHGDVKKLQDSPPEYRLQVGRYQVIFGRESGTLVILQVVHPREAQQ